jgi:replicative DNA helicase
MSIPDTRTNGSNGHGNPPAPTGPVAPPQSIEAEQSVLGSVLLSDATLYALTIEVNLRPEDFYRPAHGVIYEAMLRLYEQGEPVDRLTVVEKLKQEGKIESAGGAAAVEALSAAPPVVGNAAQYGKIVKETAQVRRLLTATYAIQQEVLQSGQPPAELIDHAERAILEVGHDDRRKDFRKVDEVLNVEIDKLMALAESGKAVTGTPSGFDDLDEITGGFQPGNLIILAARPSMGKCLASGALVFDPVTGRRRPVQDVVQDVEGGQEAFVATLGPDLKLRPAKVSDAFRNGVKPVYRLTTKLGRRVEATANHPLLTMRGWQELGTLGAGDRIAVPRNLPRMDQRQTMPDCELVMLAALIADGILTSDTPRLACGAGSPVVEDVATAADEMGCRLHVPAAGWGTGTISAGLGAARNPVTELCKRHGLWGRRSADKFVPDAVFGLTDDRIARFLAVLYGCDGHIHANERLGQIGYTTISEQLSRDVQHLLLRLGIVSKIRTLKRSAYEGTDTVAREVLITGQEDLRAFVNRVRVCGSRTAAMSRVVTGLRARRVKTNVDTAPPEAWEVVPAEKGDRSWAEVSEAAGHPRNHNWHVGRRGLSRPQLGVLASALDSRPLRALAESDVWWDEVLNVELVGEVETFDLTVPETHNFIADDIVVHNSALATNFAENASVRHNRPTVIFSLEMGESELAQRFMASQGSIKGNDLRRGKVSWPRVTAALKALNAAPLWVDDSSDLSVLDVRAKARRLAGQVEGGRLGLIVVDYLQLMRSDSRSENVVEQIGEISKGLKTLARELQVPVLALSQLSRGVEQRHDKRPMLSDLRSSGQIEQDADLVMFIYREEYYDDESEHQGEAELIIAKHRNGGLGNVQLVFQNEYPRFMPGVRDPDRYA